VIKHGVPVGGRPLNAASSRHSAALVDSPRSIGSRMTGLAPSTLAIHHGAAYTGDATKALTEFRAELAARARSELDAALATP
jgi:hypothetical protein